MQYDANPATHPKAARFGYRVTHDTLGDFYCYTRPDGDNDDEDFPTLAAAWDAAESDAGLWEDDHGAGIDALATLQAMGAELDALRAQVAGFHAVKSIRAWAAAENIEIKRDALATIDRLRALCGGEG